MKETVFTFKRTLPPSNVHNTNNYGLGTHAHVIVSKYSLIISTFNSLYRVNFLHLLLVIRLHNTEFIPALPSSRDYNTLNVSQRP